MNQIKDKQQLETAMSELPTEYSNKLSAWWCHAQKLGKLYVIEYTDIEDLTRQIDEHTAKAAKRSASRKHREHQERQTINEQCFEVISEFADVYGVTVKEVIKQLQAKTETAIEEEKQKASDAQRAAAAKIEAFKSAHSELIAEWEDLHSEQQKQALRCSKLSTLEIRKRGRGRSTESETEVKTRVLF